MRINLGNFLHRTFNKFKIIFEWNCCIYTSLEEYCRDILRCRFLKFLEQMIDRQPISTFFSRMPVKRTEDKSPRVLSFFGSGSHLPYRQDLITPHFSGEIIPLLLICDYRLEPSHIILPMSSIFFLQLYLASRCFEFFQ